MPISRDARPTRFADLLGQELVRDTLQRALASGKPGQAYLLHGPRGTGKTSTARLLARALCCESPTTKGGFEPCGACAACLAIQNEQATDVLEMDAASNRGIDDIRSLRDSVRYPPVQLKRRITIIDEVHMLTVDAFNALLKTLEEPPAHATFILATTELHRVPVTIRSRCQILPFSLLSKEVIAEKLDRLVASAGKQATPDALALIAEHAAGGMRDAESLLESLLARSDTLTLDIVRTDLGLPEASRLTELFAALANGDSTAAYTHLRSGTADVVLAELLRMTRRELELQPSPVLGRLLEVLLEASILQRAAPDPWIPLEVACWKLAATQQGTPKRAAPKPTEALPLTVVEVAPKAATPPQPEVPVVELQPFIEKDVRKAWAETAKRIGRSNPLLGQLLREAELYTADGSLLTVRCRLKLHVEKLQGKQLQAKILELMDELTQGSWQLLAIHQPNLPKRPATNALSGEASSTAAAVFGTQNV